jgi:drug/metabolite transporter (DMT)-like permease
MTRPAAHVPRSAKPQMPERRTRIDALAVGVIVILCALWGVQQVAVKVGAERGLPPELQAGLRSAVAAMLVFGWVALREGRAGVRGLLPAGATLAPALIIGALFASEFMLVYPGLHLTTASRGTLFFYTAPFFTALGAHLVLPEERLGLRQAIGLAVAFAGVGVAFADGLATGTGDLTGDLLCLLAGLLWGVTTVVVKASRGLARVRSSRVLFWQLAISAPIILVGSALLGELNHLPRPDALAWAALFYQSVIVAFLSYLAWFWLVLTYPAGRIAGFTFLTPVFGILAGVLLLGEPASLALLAGPVAIAIGLRLLSRPTARLVRNVGSI